MTLFYEFLIELAHKPIKFDLKEYSSVFHGRDIWFEQIE